LQGPGNEISGYFTGNHSLHTAIAEIRVVAAHRPLDEQQSQLTRDQGVITRCLEWPNNWVLIEGLCGLEVSDWGLETTDDPPIKTLVLQVHITYREYQP